MTPSTLTQQTLDRFTDDGNPLDKSQWTMAQLIAQAASAFEQRRTGHAPKSVTVVQRNGTLGITMYGALSLAEQALAKSPAGAAQVQEFHRQLFANASDSPRLAIKRITGVEVREASEEVELATGTMVQVYLLTQSISAHIWNGRVPRDSL